MKRFALYLGITAALVASCSIQEENFEAPQKDDVVFYASFEQPSEGTRVYANEDLLLRWTVDDRVSIFNKNTYNQEYRFIGETGDYEGGFNKVGDPEFITGKEISHVVSVYPFQRQTRVTENEVVFLTMPASQSYAQDSFGLGANTMVSVSSGNLLYYKNVGGYLMLKLYGEGVSVSSITLKGNNGEKLAGNASVTMPLNGDPSVEMASDATTEITLVCDTPVHLGATAEESVQFWFVLPPGMFSNGFTVSISQANGNIFEKSTTKSITIERSNLSKMSPMEVEGGTPTVPTPEAVDLGLPSGLKWASFNLGASKPEEYGDYYAWGETEPYYSSQDPLTWKDGKTGYNWASYKWCMGSENTITKYCQDPSYGYNGFTDTKTVLDPEDDAASVNLGGKWRMPTDTEWTELRTECTWTWTTRNGVDGRLVTGPSGNSIFFPAAGFRGNTSLNNAGSEGSYCSSSINTEGPSDALRVHFNSDNVNRRSSFRYYGRSVRPVYGDFISVESVSLNKTFSMVVGATLTLTATVTPSNATDKSVTWTSSNTSVATVSSTGVVTAITVGSATITVKTNDGGKTATCSVTVEPAPIPEAVDLGLPSGLKWASFNLGASAPEEYGGYYAWGETEPKNNYSLSTYKWCKGSYTTMTKYCSESSWGDNGFTDTKTVLDAEDDAASVNLGRKWRMPTDTEWTELRTECTWTWTTRNGVDGRLVTGPSGNSIFFPAAGYRGNSAFGSVGSYGVYWSSSLYTDNPCDAWNVYFSSGDVYRGQDYRFRGFSVRPVIE